MYWSLLFLLLALKDPLIALPAIAWGMFAFWASSQSNWGAAAAILTVLGFCLGFFLALPTYDDRENSVSAAFMMMFYAPLMFWLLLAALLGACAGALWRYRKFKRAMPLSP